MKNERFRAIIGTLILLIQNGKVLLAKRKNTGFGDGFWAFPGGHLNGNEPMQEGLARECFEELGITLNKETLRYVTAVHVAPHFRTDQEVVLFCFSASSWQGTLENKEPDRCEEIRFFSFDEMPQNFLEGSKQCFDDFLEQRSFSELHWKESSYNLLKATNEAATQLGVGLPK